MRGRAEGPERWKCASDSCTLGQGGPQEEVTRGNEKAKGEEVFFKDGRKTTVADGMRWAGVQVPPPF